MWILIAILGQFILGTAAVADKLLLRKRVSDPVVYTFWIGVLGIFAALLLPFGFLYLPMGWILLALFSGVIFIFSLLILFLGLSQIDASSVLPLTSAVIPLWTFAFSFFLISTKMTFMDIIGMMFLVVGTFFFFFAERNILRARLMICAIASAGLYGLSIVLQKLVFEHSNFTTGFFWAKIGEVLGALILLLFSQWRKRILSGSVKISGKDRFWYVSNRAWAAVGSVLLNAAVFLSHPALVQSTQSFRYVVIFITAWFVLKEYSHGKMLYLKIGASIFAIIGIAWIGMTAYARSIPYNPSRDIHWGVTFSERYSARLGLDPKENLSAILQDLHPRNIRLIAYWDEIESAEGVYDFSSLDWQFEKASQTHTNVILTVGMRVPRWPECFIPAWAVSFDPERRESVLRDYLAAIHNHYWNHPALLTWQIENEPFLHFGQCPARGAYFLEKEIEIFRTQNAITRPVPPILITDGGEYGKWYGAAKQGDMFGTTMYRKIYPPSIGHYTGAFEYPIAPSFFRLKEKIIRLLLHDYSKSFIVIELQSEPWGKVEIPLLSVEEQVSLFSPAYFKETIEYAKQTGFSDYYLWGAEWWYAMKVKNNDSRYWDIAKQLFGNK